MTRSVRYENTLIGLVFLTFGTIFLDRPAQFYLAPYLIPDLHVNNIPIGMMASALAVARIEACSTPWHDRERPVPATERTQFWRAARAFRLAAAGAVALILVLGSGVAFAASWDEIVKAANAEGEVDVHGGPGKLYSEVLTEGFARAWD